MTICKQRVSPWQVTRGVYDGSLQSSHLWQHKKHSERRITQIDESTISFPPRKFRSMWLGCVDSLRPSKMMAIIVFLWPEHKSPNSEYQKPSEAWGSILVGRGYRLSLSSWCNLEVWLWISLHNPTGSESAATVILTFLTPNKTDMSHLRFIPNMIKISWNQLLLHPRFIFDESTSRIN